MNSANHIDPERIERRAQQRAKEDKKLRIGSRLPTDPINVARLDMWKRRVRELAIKRHRMEAL